MFGSSVVFNGYPPRFYHENGAYEEFEDRINTKGQPNKGYSGFDICRCTNAGDDYENN